jgi:hypothetical protein
MRQGSLNAALDDDQLARSFAPLSADAAQHLRRSWSAAS